VPTIGQLITGLFRKSVAPEGEPRPGPWPTINPDGILPNEWGQFWNYWQMGYDPLPLSGTSAVVEACVQAYAQTIAMCPGEHWWTNEDGGRERVTSSALSRILKRPNDYQSRSDFLLNLAHDLYSEGNAYALAQRNDRYEVSALHLFNPGQSRARVGEGGEIFYELAGNNVIEATLGVTGAIASPGRLVVPARDVLHIKLEVKRGEPLVGTAPLRHAAAAIAAQNAIGSQLISFFSNMSRPSGILSTPLNLTEAQIKRLRELWNEQSKGLNAGGTPILTNDLKFQGMSVSARDAEMAAALKLTQDDIFMVYGVPPAILGMTDKSTFSSTEALMQFWLARGLGFAINHVEVAFDHFFGLKGWPHEYVEFDTQALLRVAYKDRIEALARGVQGGIFAPNEARNSEDLPDAPYGDEPRVQQQVVPLSAWAETPPKTPAPEATPPAPPAGGGDGAVAGQETGEGKSLLAELDRAIDDSRRAA
jgi:HK97 family phage portal protein